MPACSLPPPPLSFPFPLFWGLEATQALSLHVGRVCSTGQEGAGVMGAELARELARSAGRRWAGQSPRER